MTALPDVCDVALPIPALEPYSYAIPAGLADVVVPGARVVVSVRSRETVGLVVATGSRAGSPDVPNRLKPVLLAPDPEPLVTPSLLELARWLASYYAAPIGVTLRAMLPAALWGTSVVSARLRDRSAAPGGVGGAVVDFLAGRRSPASTRQIRRAIGRPVWDVLQRLERMGVVELSTRPPSLGPSAATERVVSLVKSLPSLIERDQTFARAPRQRQAYETLDELGGEVSLARLIGELGFSRGVVKGLEDRGVAAVSSRPTVRDPFAGASSPAPDVLTADQEAAVRRLLSLEEGGAALLFGVTGSGKTLVYLRAMEAAVREGRGAIVLVPEIALTPQTIARVRGVFGDTVAVLHSGLSDGERADAWRELAAGRRRVAVGARSAVFAPVRDLAAIVVDEEHDGSYKNGEAPRYHARDVALRRARLEGARAILGTATPSLETWHARDRIAVVPLPNRATARPLPPVELVDLRHAERVDGSGPVPWSTRLDSAVAGRLARGEQVILLLNRRGFAHYLQCGDCAAVVECPSCSIALTVHRTPPRLRCHYCGHERAVPEVCPACGGATQRTRGVGTQSLERWLTHRYPEARLARMDADTTGTKWSHARILEDVAAGNVDVLFGTQMIAKGLDFPGVTLVGVVNADTGLHFPDFRAAERTFQLIAQVAGRAGRGPRGGLVVVQTHVPDHYALVAAAAHDYEAFASRELQERTTPAYPPHVSLANVIVSGGREGPVGRAAADVADWIRGLVATRQLDAEVVGPAPAPLARIKNRWRWHLLVRSPDSRVIGRLIRYASTRAPHAGGGAIRIVFDRDPVSLL